MGKRREDVTHSEGEEVQRKKKKKKQARVRVCVLVVQNVSRGVQGSLGVHGKCLSSPIHPAPT